MSKPPLWEVIESCDAFMPVHGLLRRRLIALLIRAVRDWLVPEELIEDAPGRFVNGCCLDDRQRLRALLTSEADRAECLTPPIESD